MTEPRYEEADILQFAGADEDRDTSHDRVPFRLAGADTVYVGVRPKLAILLEVMEALNDDTDEAAQMVAFSDLLDEVLDEESVVDLRARLRDKEDALDLDSPGIENMFRTLVGLWYGGPTGRARGSRRSPARTGRRSTARARSGASTR